MRQDHQPSAPFERRHSTAFAAEQLSKITKLISNLIGASPTHYPLSVRNADYTHSSKLNSILAEFVPSDPWGVLILAGSIPAGKMGLEGPAAGEIVVEDAV